MFAKNDDIPEDVLLVLEKIREPGKERLTRKEIKELITRVRIPLSRVDTFLDRLEAHGMIYRTRDQHYIILKEEHGVTR